MWLYRTGRDAPQQLVLFEYRESRRAEHLEEFLNVIAAICMRMAIWAIIRCRVSRWRPAGRTRGESMKPAGDIGKERSRDV